MGRIRVLALCGDDLRRSNTLLDPPFERECQIPPGNLPFQFATGIQTSNLISESLVGLMTPATRQRREAP
jgi:hypothetical protein